MSAGGVVLRADSGLHIGTGHVMRCLTLADVLKKAGVSTTFVSRAHAGHVLSVISGRGHRLVVLSDSMGQSYGDHPHPPAHAGWLGADWRADAAATRQELEISDAKWLVVDHYALDISWQEEALPAGVSLLVIDDLADRPHRADLLVDQNIGRKAEDYAGLVSSNCDLLIGPTYALLRPEFARLRPRALARREVMTRPEGLLVTLGGIDRDNDTCRVLNALAQTPDSRGMRVTVVMGDNAPHLELVRAKAASIPIPTEVVSGVTDMAQRMMNADLCIGAAGSTAWERCAMGLPTLHVVLADNQIGAAQAMAAQGVSLALSSPQSLDFASSLAAGLRHISQAGAYRAIASAAAALTDGAGVTRVSQMLLQRAAHAN